VSSSWIAKVKSGQRKRVAVTKKRPQLRRRRHTARGGQAITVDTMEVTWSSCSDASANGTTQTISLGGSPLDTGMSQQISDDGITYKGSYTDSGSPYSTQYDWALEGH
jgi:hypothetical protein